jgi:hypothetical protein
MPGLDVNAEHCPELLSLSLLIDKIMAQLCQYPVKAARSSQG